MILLVKSGFYFPQYNIPFLTHSLSKIPFWNFAGVTLADGDTDTILADDGCQ